MKEKKSRTNDKSPTEYSKTSCVNCKRGHRKCDKLLSGCSYCEKTGKVCSYRTIARVADPKLLNENDDNDDENDLSHHLLQQHYRHHPYLPSTSTSTSTTTLITNNMQNNQQQQCQQPLQEQDLIHLELSPPASPQYSISEMNDNLSIVVGGEMLMLEQQQQQQQQQQDSLLVNFDDYDLLHHPPSSLSPSISQPSFTTEESKSPLLLFHPYSSSASSSSLSPLLSPLPPPMGDTPLTIDIHASSNMTMQQQQQSVLVEPTNKKTNSLMDIASTLERIENMQQQLLEQYQLTQHNQQLARQFQYDNRSGHMTIPMNLNLNDENDNNCLVLRGRDDSISASTRGSNSDNKSNDDDDEIKNDSSSSSGSGKIVKKRMIDEIISSFASHHSDRKVKSSRSPEFNSDAILMDDDMLSAPIYFPFDRRINNLTELMTNRSNMDSVMKAYFNVFCMGVPLMGTSESLEVATELTSFQHVDQMIENRGKKSNTLLFLAIQTCCLQRLGHSDIARQLYNYCLQLLTQQMFGCPFNHSDKDRDGNLACALITLAFYLIGEGRDNKQQVKLFLVNCRFYVSNIMQNRSETQQVLDSEARSNRFSRLSAIYKYMNLIELVLNDDDLDDSIEIIKRFVSIFDGVCGKNAKNGKSCSSLQV